MNEWIKTGDEMAEWLVLLTEDLLIINSRPILPQKDEYHQEARIVRRFCSSISVVRLKMGIILSCIAVRL